jgi:Na+-driven multidrug efflux pump
VLGIGIPNGVENAMFTFGRLLTQTLISMLGTTVIAANSVALSIANYQYAVNTAFCCAAVPIVGQCIGAMREDQAKYYSRLLIKLEYVMLWGVIAITVVLLGPLLSTYDVSAAAKDLAYWLVISHSLVVAFIYPLGFLLPSVFRAASDVKFTLVVSMLSMWGIRIAFAYVLALPEVSLFGLFSFDGFNMGMWGVWIAMMLDWVCRAVLYTIRFFTDKWLLVRKLY